MSEIKDITNCIEDYIQKSSAGTGIIVYPCGDIGIRTIEIMKGIYGIVPDFIVDDKKCAYSKDIYPTSLFKTIDRKKYYILLASTNREIYIQLKEVILRYFDVSNIIELDCMRNIRDVTEAEYAEYKTQIGRYSYGPICIKNHPWIESIGSFCSFAEGVSYVTNHEMRYISTHPFIYEGKNIEGYEYPFSLHKAQPYYMTGIEPKVDKIRKQKRAVIGNDVWLGQNVIVTNSANLGNGVIGAAGAVITKDVPDYAIVAGVPARILRFRYKKEQIEALNKISWWEWSDEEIRIRYDDFYLPVDQFIKKYI